MTELAAIRELKIVDLGLGMAAALCSKFLRESGARVTRVPLPDGDPFRDVYPAYEAWHEGNTVARHFEADALLADADVCIVGGEDYPGTGRNHDADELARKHPRL